MTPRTFFEEALLAAGPVQGRILMSVVYMPYVALAMVAVLLLHRFTPLDLGTTAVTFLGSTFMVAFGIVTVFFYLKLIARHHTAFKLRDSIYNSSFYLLLGLFAIVTVVPLENLMLLLVATMLVVGSWLYLVLRFKVYTYLNQGLYEKVREKARDCLPDAADDREVGAKLAELQRHMQNESTMKFCRRADEAEELVACYRARLLLVDEIQSYADTGDTAAQKILPKVESAPLAEVDEWEQRWQTHKDMLENT